MSGQAADLAQALARHAEAVCRYYLPNGRRHGRYWLVGDINNTPGRSLYVRLAGPDHGPGAAGKWTDAATGEHGDLLDLIAANRGLRDFRDLCDEARHFLSLPPPKSLPARRPRHKGRRKPRAGCFTPGFRSRIPMPKPICAPAASPRRSTACRCASIPGSGIGATAIPAASPGRDCSPPSPMCTAGSPAFTAPGSIAVRPEKAPLPDPRRALGHLLGNGVRFGPAEPAPAQAGVLLAGEGIETVLVAEIHLAPYADDRGTVGQPSRGAGIHGGARPAVCRAGPRRGGPHGVRTTPHPWESRRGRGARSRAGTGGFQRGFMPGRI